MPVRLCINNGSMILGGKLEKNGTLLVADGKISAVHKRREGGCRGEREVIDAKGLFVSPGFIDIHAHGLFADSADNLCEGDLSEMCRRMARYGVTAFLATTVSLPPKKLLGITRTVKCFKADHPDTNLLGLHFEGPYINPKVSGAQNCRNIRSFKESDLKGIFSECKGAVKMVTFAPEIKNGYKLLRFLKSRNAVASIGHSVASYEEVERAVSGGARNVTHLFNAMPQLHHRQPGLIGAALTLDSLFVDIIADGLHLDPATVKLVIRAKGTDKVVLISDAIGSGKASFKLGGLKVRVSNREARLENGHLAGSVIGLNDAVRNVIKFTGISLPEAVGMVTLNPARLLGVDGSKGSLEAGKDADIIAFDRRLNVKLAIVKGNIAFNNI